MEIADETAPRTVDPITDAKWHEKLNAAQAQLVATDFGMQNGSAMFSCLRTLLWYAGFR